MAGGMFAGHDQSGGEVVEENGKKFKMFYGMSSATAMEESNKNCCRLWLLAVRSCSSNAGEGKADDFLRQR